MKKIKTFLNLSRDYIFQPNLFLAQKGQIKLHNGQSVCKNGIINFKPIEKRIYQLKLKK